MKLIFKKQGFQTDAAQAVVDVLKGQPYNHSPYLVDPGYIEPSLFSTETIEGERNTPIAPEVKVLDNIRAVQIRNGLKPSTELAQIVIKTKKGKDKSKAADEPEGITPNNNIPINLTIDMETGTGKTYTYIKTIFELNKAYGFTKFIVIVPSTAIKEGVSKSFEITKDHFFSEYTKRIISFVYNSDKVNDVQDFATSNDINVMIINSQSFNKDSNLISIQREDFGYRIPIEVIKKTNPILIIDEPQSVEGEKTQIKLTSFDPIMILRYSATHKEEYNKIYRLDAIDAYTKRLVKKITVKGISEVGIAQSDGFVYLEKINLSSGNPKATIHFNANGARSAKRKVVTVDRGYNLFENSGNREEYRDNYIVEDINGQEDYIEFRNGVKLYAGCMIGSADEEQLARIQIRETILTHIEREQQLYYDGVKVLSLFFIDRVDNYRVYNENGTENGIYATIFQEEYQDIVNNLQPTLYNEDYLTYLHNISVSDTHSGYFYMDKDKKGNGYHAVGAIEEIDSKRRAKVENETYELIMRNKEQLLSLDEPVRFIFSHSALREGWDNPNVFQICTLKQSNSDIKKRQEVGRGLRLCVNQDGQRLDKEFLGDENQVHEKNVLTVIASESYESFVAGFQSELAEIATDKPRKVTADLFKGKTLVNVNDEQLVVTDIDASIIVAALCTNGYINKADGSLTDKYFDDKRSQNITLPEDLIEYAESIINVLDSVYDARATLEKSKDSVPLTVNEDYLHMTEFRELWSKINAKTSYTVDFDTNEFVKNAVAALDSELRVTSAYYKITLNELEADNIAENVSKGTAFNTTSTKSRDNITAGSTKRFDLVGKLTAETGLTRQTVVDILMGIKPYTFDKFKQNPEEFIIQATRIINEQKGSAIVEHITYNILDQAYDTDILTKANITGQLNVNTRKATKHLFDYVRYDSDIERKLSTELDESDEVAVYIKLPHSFFISTPVGRYNPDWAIAFHDGSVKHIYFVAETKGSLSSLELRGIEESKISCARKHFEAISNSNVVYEVVDSYENLLKLVRS